MRKTMLGAALIAAMIFTGCSSDDDGGSRSCNLLGLIPVTLVDNGDGTASIQIEGEEPESFDLGDMDFNTFADQVCSGDFELDLDLTE